jgi:hypothetical protein
MIFYIQLDNSMIGFAEFFALEIAFQHTAVSKWHNTIRIA